MLESLYWNPFQKSENRIFPPAAGYISKYVTIILSKDIKQFVLRPYWECELSAESIKKFNALKIQWKTVQPACSGKCSNAPNKGWIMKGAIKKGVRPAKRKHAVSIDLLTFRPPPIEESFQNWLAHSKPAWDELVYMLRTKSLIKKRRKRE